MMSDDSRAAACPRDYPPFHRDSAFIMGISLITSNSRADGSAIFMSACEPAAASFV